MYLPKLLTLFILLKSINCATWYNFIPYNGSSCSGTPYGLGYSNLVENYCTSAVDSKFNTITSTVTSGSVVRLQYYLPTATSCASTSFANNFSLNTCQDAQNNGYVVPNSLFYSNYLYANSSTSPLYLTSSNQSVVLFTFYNLACTSPIAYNYFNGYTIRVDPNENTIKQHYYCSSGIPYKRICDAFLGCDSPVSIAQSTCSANSSYFNAKTVTCV